MLTLGQTAPEFSLQDANSTTHHLNSYNGKIVVLYFYPKDDTPGCTIEAKEFSELSGAFKAEDSIVFGVSKDSIESHCSFRDKYGLSVTLLSDPSGSVTEAYGALGEKSNYGKTYMGIMRTTVVIDKTSKIAKIWTSVKAAGHAAKVLEFVKEIK